MTQTDWIWFTLPTVNPEPWAVGDMSVGRKGGKMYPIVGRNNTVWLYQQAVKEGIGETDVWLEGKIELDFYFWRNMAEYKTPQARTARNKEADLTNMIKATEDALQGVLFKNDKDVVKSHGHIIEQSPTAVGGIVFGIRNFTDTRPLNGVLERMAIARAELEYDDENTGFDPGEEFGSASQPYPYWDRG